MLHFEVAHDTGLVLEIMRYIGYIIDWFDDEWATIDITDEDAEVFFKLSQDDIYEHLKKSIGVVTPYGASKLVPRYNIGKLSISVQFAYYLWSKRADEKDGWSVDDSPITQEEFIEIVGSDANNTHLLDVMVEWDGTRILPPTQMKLHDLVSHLVSEIY